METITTNTTTDLNICQAADDIIEIFNDLGFTSDVPPDVEVLRHLIIETIQNRTYTPILPIVNGEIYE